MGIIPDEIFKIIAASEPSPMEPGMHGQITVKKPGGDFLDQITKIKEICENIIDAYGSDDSEESDKGKDEDNEFRKMRSKSKGQSEEDDGKQEDSIEEERK